MIRTLARRHRRPRSRSAPPPPRAARSATGPRLKAEATVTGDIVRIGDLVENAGIVAKVPIFRAPDLGSTGTVPADAVVEAVRAHALIGLDTGGVSEVVVTRASRTIPAKDIEDRVAQALSAQFALGARQGHRGEFRPRAARDPRRSRPPRASRASPASITTPRSGRFDVTLDMPTGATTRGTLRLSGRAAATVEVVTAGAAGRARRGAQGPPTCWSSGARAPRSAATSSPTATRRSGSPPATRLQPGRPLRLADLMKPELVQRNETVTLVYEVPGITLTVRGKAAEGGAEGDVIIVLNEQSKRTVQGVVVGPGRVVISTGSPRLAANLPPRQPKRTPRRV